jgi:hypothetical protein
VLVTAKSEAGSTTTSIGFQALWRFFVSVPSADAAHWRASKARRVQSYPPDHPKVVEADQNLAALRIEKYINTVLAEAPPLSDEQRTKLAELLRPVRIRTRSGGDAA